MLFLTGHLFKFDRKKGVQFACWDVLLNVLSVPL